MATQAQSMVRMGQSTLGIAQTLLNGVGPEIFARQPKGPDGAAIDCNHPAFVLGHLSIYPARVLQMLGHEPGEATVPEGFQELFAAGVACQDDPDGAIYPAMDRVVSFNDAAHQALLNGLTQASGEQLQGENPNQGMRERLGLQTLGEGVLFLLTSHAQFHLGQISTWRRAMGLGSAM